MVCRSERALILSRLPAMVGGLLKEALHETVTPR